VRSSAGFFLFVPEDYDKDVIAQSGLRLLVGRDITSNMAEVAAKRRAAREARSAAVREIEGHATYEAQAELSGCDLSPCCGRPALPLSVRI
jgi:hypothetical protein